MARDGTVLYFRIASVIVEPTLIGIVSALTALTASITGPVVSVYVARAQIRASVRSANRQRWIDDFRDTIARLCGQIAVATQLRSRIITDGHVTIAGDADLQQFEHLIATTTKVRLMTNPLDRQHCRLVVLIDELLATLRTNLSDADIQVAARASALEIQEVSLAIIRSEWMRVQKGS